jgi:hypothetical protein
MKKMLAVLFLMFTLLFAVTVNAGDNWEDNIQKKDWGNSDINSLQKGGTSMYDVIKRFGKPERVQRNEDKTIVLDYKKEAAKDGVTTVTNLTIIIKGGKIYDFSVKETAASEK